MQSVIGRFKDIPRTCGITLLLATFVHGIITCGMVLQMKMRCPTGIAYFLQTILSAILNTHANMDFDFSMTYGCPRQ